MDKITTNKFAICNVDRFCWNCNTIYGIMRFQSYSLCLIIHFFVVSICIRYCRGFLSSTDLSSILFKSLFRRETWIDTIANQSCISTNFKMTLKLHELHNLQLKIDTMGHSTSHQSPDSRLPPSQLLCARSAELLSPFFGLLMTLLAWVHLFVIAVFFKWKMDRNLGNVVNRCCRC